MRKFLLFILNVISIGLIAFNVYDFKLKIEGYDIAKETKQQVVDNINNEKRPALIFKNGKGNMIVFDYNNKMIYLDGKELCKINEITDEYIKTDKGDIDINIDPRYILVKNDLELKRMYKDMYLSFCYYFPNYESYNNLVKKEVLKLVNEEDNYFFGYEDENEITLNVEGEEFSFGSNHVFAISNLDDAEFLSRNMKCVTSLCSS